MNIRRLSFILPVLLFFAMAVAVVNAEGEGNNKTTTLNKPTGEPVRTYFNINNISTVFKYDGISDIDVNEANSGLVFPKGSGKTAVFQSGFLWGARVAGRQFPQVGGTAYRTGLVPGRITNSGLPVGQLTGEDPNGPSARIFRVRPDVYPGGPDVDLSGDATLEVSSAAALRAQYELDWNEWPAAKGAPYDDVDQNGSYDPTIDIPGVPGADQTIWFVANDLDVTQAQYPYGANPLGIEMQATIWGYAQTGALGNMFFRKYRIINKSDTPFDSMYVSMWSDVDLGNASDDYAGCDIDLSLGYCYNANAADPTYNPLPPPAVGFDFFQGPISNGDTLGMTAFYYFARGDPSVTDPTQGDIQGSVQFYNFFQGKIGLTGAFFVDPTTGQPTTYALNGDPQLGTGWLDGQLLPAGDRRIGSASGPFTMAPGDTQDVVVSEIVAGAIPGVDRISAIGLMKFYDQFAQFAYDNNFDLPVPPPSPSVNVAGYAKDGQTGGPINGIYYSLDKKIVLDWGEDLARVAATENYTSKGHSFEGYNVYQLPSATASVSEGVRVATFDVVNGVLKINDDVFDPVTGSVINIPTQFGNDTGIRRYLEITSDAIKGGTPLINGIRYYFAVTAYSYNPDAPVGKSLENPLRVLTIVPQSKNPGQVVGGEFSDTLAVERTGGQSDGNVYPIVVDPTKITGLTYTVTFDTLNGGVVWNLDRSDNVRVLENQTNQNADEQSPIVDGIQWRVIGAPLDFKSFDITSNAAGEITDALCTYEITKPGADGKGISADWYRDVLLSPHGGAISGCTETPMQVAGGFMFMVAGGPTIGDHTAAVGRWARDGARFDVLIPNNYEIRWTGDAANPAGKGWMAFSTGSLVDVPFECWFLGPNLDDPSDDVRMMPWVFDDDGDDAFSFKLDHEASGGNNDPYSDWIYFMMPNDNPQPGEADYDALVAAMTPDPVNWAGDVEVEHIARMVIMNWNQNQGSGGENEWPEIGTTFRVRMTIPNAAGEDVFVINTAESVINNDLAKSELEKIQVFPNPYYGVNSEEINKYNRFVTFSHLPAKATVRIFNLAGVQVKKIEKDDPGQFLRWDLANQSGLPVASGLYIAYIDMPDLGETKVLKLAIIQEQQILDRF